ncbi:MepB family protein [Arthrobacter sp. ISL-95]|uniref:MepB family protein n=1 Tax=Arthrobacter sp. ISL-95 TaxID=2819116 RepID=UPI001BE7BCF6|nr:MepB family protein [Arthrobacter sp. ISL-95]MBT2585303.1 MepB family protein [Arthrobacter sp. ISL-95]
MPDHDVHPDVAEALLTLSQSSLSPSVPVPEADNHEYGAAVATLGQERIRFRVGKLTPTKVGLFVAVWRRAQDGSTEPFPAEDGADLLVITVREGTKAGRFAFPKSALVRHGIVSVNGAGGKRGFRVYPPWSQVANRQAVRTQQWQCGYFTEGSATSDNNK